MIRSVCTGFVNSPLFRKRSPEAKLLWYALYLHQAQHMCGLFRLDLEHMALDAQLPLERTKEALAELIQHKLCQFDAAQDLVCVHEMTAQAAKVVCPEWKGFAPMDRYIASLGPSTLCKTVCDTLSIPYRYRTDTLLTDPDPGSVLDSGTDTGFAVGHAPPPPTPTPTAPSLPGLDPGTQEKPRKAPRSKSATASNPELQTLAVGLLGELSAAIQSVRPSARELRPIPGNLEHIAERLADGATADEVRHVIAVYAAESRHNEKSLQYFNPVSPFRRDNFARALARTVADASKPERQRAPPWRPDPSIGSNPGEHTPAKDWDSWRNR